MLPVYGQPSMIEATSVCTFGIVEQGGATSYLVCHQQDGVAVRYLVRSVGSRPLSHLLGDRTAQRPPVTKVPFTSLHGPPILSKFSGRT